MTDISSDIGYDMSASQIISQRLTRAASEQNSRKAEAFAKIPELQTIDAELLSVSRGIPFAALGGPSELGRLRLRWNSLKEKESQLLTAAGFPPDHLDIRYTCSLCHDTGYTKEGLCSCYKELLARPPKELARFSFDNFDCSRFPQGEQREYATTVLKAVKNFCSGFPNVKSMTFSGDTGLGKTHLAAAAHNELRKNGVRALFTSAYDMFEVFEQKAFGKADEDDVDKFYSSELLVIDDLGSERFGTNTVPALLNLLNKRTVPGKKTLITTNLDAKKLSDIYTGRAASRLCGEFIYIRLSGKDARFDSVK